MRPAGGMPAVKGEAGELKQQLAQLVGNTKGGATEVRKPRHPANPAPGPGEDAETSEASRRRPGARAQQRALTNQSLLMISIWEQ